MFANASSVSSTVSARRARTEPTPPAATVVSTSAGPEIDGCESTRIAQEPLRERARCDRDHGDLEDRPAEALEYVQPGCEIGAALPERRAVQRHRRHACVGADQCGGAEHRVANHRADQRREECLLQRE